MSTPSTGRAERLLAVLRTLPSGTTATNSELAALMGNSERLVMMALTELTDRGLIRVDRYAPNTENRAGRAITVLVEVSA